MEQSVEFTTSARSVLPHVHIFGHPLGSMILVCSSVAPTEVDHLHKVYSPANQISSVDRCGWAATKDGARRAVHVGDDRPFH